MKIRLEEKFDRIYSNLESLLNEARSSQQLLDILDRFYLYNGFNNNGEGWVILGDTYNIRDQIKADGGKYNSNIRHWILPIQNKNYNLFKVIATDLFDANPATGVLDYRYSKNNPTVVSAITNAENALKQSVVSNNTVNGIPLNTTPNMPTNQRWAIGDHIAFRVSSMVLKLAKPGAYGTTYVYEIVDDVNNFYVWYTSKDIQNLIDVEIVEGIVKGYQTYRGQDFTVLKNCKIKYIGSNNINTGATTVKKSSTARSTNTAQQPVQQSTQQSTQQPTQHNIQPNGIMQDDVITTSFKINRKRVPE